MSINDEIIRTQKRLQELRKRQAKKERERSFAFFRDNSIEHLLKDDKEMKQFTAEIEPILNKYRRIKNEKLQEKADDENG